MPVHDWSRVFDGAFHAFHVAWIAKLQNTLNNGVLPPDYYAMAEKVAGSIELRSATLPAADGGQNGLREGPIAGAISAAEVPPRVWLRDVIEAEPFTRRQKSIVIRRSNDERIIALIEILSAGNKSSRREFQAFLTEVADALARGCHLLLVNLHSRTRRDPDGIYPEIWAEVGGEPRRVSADKPLALAAFDAGPPVTSYVEPITVGDTLIDMPLFLAPDWYVSVPLEATYEAAYRSVPRRFREVLESPREPVE